VKSDISFDRIADRYDETRGGLSRGLGFVRVLDTLLEPGSDVLEIGVGTGAVAQPVVECGHQLWGIDLSRAMLTRAATRVGRLVEGDAARLPFAGDAFDAVIAVWALHVVGDQERLTHEIDRVLRPKGRLIVVAPRPEVESNDLADLTYGWGRLLDKADRTEQVTRLLTADGWSAVAQLATAWEQTQETPADRADSIERRDWSSLWDLDDETWSRAIQPVIEALRGLPQPDRPRTLRVRYAVAAFTRDDG